MRVRADPQNTSEPDLGEQVNARPVSKRNSDRDETETQMDYFFMNRKSDIGLMRVLNLLACESGCTLVFDGVEGPG